MRTLAAARLTWLPFALAALHCGSSEGPPPSASPRPLHTADARPSAAMREVCPDLCGHVTAICPNALPSACAPLCDELSRRVDSRCDPSLRALAACALDTWDVDCDFSRGLPSIAGCEKEQATWLRCMKGKRRASF